MSSSDDLTSEQSWRGSFWLPAKPDEPQQGSLTYTPDDGVILRLIGGFDDRKRVSTSTIEILQGMRDRVGWVALYAPDAVQAFIDELAAREEQPDEDSFCIWCHHRDELEARKFIRGALNHAAPDVVLHQ